MPASTLAHERIAGVRRMCEADLPSIARIYAMVFQTQSPATPAALERYQAYLRAVFLDNPWQDGAIGALVHEDPGGRVSGFLGVVPRTFVYRGKKLLGAVSSNFMTDPEWRIPGAGLKLLAALLSGPQELSLTDESNDASRAIWERLGGGTVFSTSVRWTWPVRPFEYAAELAGRRFPALASRVLIAAARPVDRLAAHWGAPFALREPATRAEDLTPRGMRRCVAAGGYALTPEYDRTLLAWLFERAHRMTRYGSLRRVLVKAASGEDAGYLVYYLNAGGKCEVLSTFALPGRAPLVFGHLLSEARGNGAVVLAGSLMPRLLPAFPDHAGFLWRRGRWTLVHSRRPELMDAFYRGDAYFSRLDGEWCQTHLTDSEVPPA